MFRPVSSEYILSSQADAYTFKSILTIGGYRCTLSATIHLATGFYGFDGEKRAIPLWGLLLIVSISFDIDEVSALLAVLGSANE